MYGNIHYSCYNDVYSCKDLSHSTWVGIVQGKRNAILFNPCPSSVTFEHPHPDLNYTGEGGRQVCHFKNDSFKMNNSTNIDIGFPNKSVGLFLEGRRTLLFRTLGEASSFCKSFANSEQIYFAGHDCFDSLKRENFCGDNLFWSLVLRADQPKHQVCPLTRFCV